MAAFKIAELQRNRTLAWNKAGNKSIKSNGMVKAPGEAIVTSDLVDADGKPDVALCERFGVKPQDVAYITVNDLPEAYRKGPKDALTALAKEWSDGAKDDDGKPITWTPDEVAHYLVLQSRLQDAANASVKQHRPVTDKALDRGVSTIIRALKGQGKTLDEVRTSLSALGLQIADTTLRESYGA